MEQKVVYYYDARTVSGLFSNSNLKVRVFCMQLPLLYYTKFKKTIKRYG